MSAKEISGHICESCGNPTYSFFYVENAYYVCSLCRSEHRYDVIEEEPYVSTTYDDTPVLQFQRKG